MSIAAELLQRHIQTLVDDHQKWQTLIADDILWELAYAPSIGHPAKLSGRDEVLHHVRWLLGAVENFRGRRNRWVQRFSISNRGSDLLRSERRHGASRRVRSRAIRTPH